MASGCAAMQRKLLRGRQADGRRLSENHSRSDVPQAQGASAIRFRSKRRAGSALHLPPNIWEELHGLADGLKIPLERAAVQYSNARLSFPKRGCSSVMTNAFYGRNYDYSPRRYDPTLVAVQPKGVHASLAFSDRFTGRVDGMNEHGLCVGL